MTTYFPIDPLAEIFPVMSPDEFQRLVDDIRLNGQREPIWLYQGKIIDGRNRYHACQVLGIEPITREWDGNGSLISFIVSLNLHRRHLSESQRAMVAAKLATYNLGDNQYSKEGSSIEPPVTQDEAAKLLNVSVASLKRAKKVIRDGVSILSEKVESDEITVARAEQIARQPKGKQMRLLRRAGKSVIEISSKTKTKKLKHEPIHFCLLCNKDLEVTPTAFLNYIDRMSEKLKGIYSRCLQNMAEEFVGIENLPEIQELNERIQTAFSYGIHEFNDLVKMTKIPRDVLDETLRVGVTNHFWDESEQGGKTAQARGARKRLFFPLKDIKPEQPEMDNCTICLELGRLRQVGNEKLCSECLQDRQHNSDQVRDFRLVLGKYNYRDERGKPLVDYEDFGHVITNEDFFQDENGNPLTKFVVYLSLKEEFYG